MTSTTKTSRPKRLLKWLSHNKELSIIIPAYNEEGNIAALVQQLKGVCSKNQILYEIIIIDDHSTDNTKQAVSHMVNNKNVFLFDKRGKQGKSFSIIEGVSRARYSTIAMIDADLQYPPSALPKMMSRILAGYDVVVANRNEKSYNIIRRVLSRSFAFVFGRLLHGLDCDVQSGLKVFSKGVFDHVTLNPTPWTFDMEFLTQAKAAGYKIGTVDINFQSRKAGASKINLMQAVWEIGTGAMRLKFKGPIVAHFPRYKIKKEGVGFYFNGKKFIPHTKLRPEMIALASISYPQKIIILSLTGFAVMAFLLNWHFSATVFISIITLMYMGDFLFNLFLIYRSFKFEPELKPDQNKMESFKENEWPTYTIFCPLYKEWEVLPQFVKAMSGLDYPQKRLQIILLLEEDDVKTVQKIREQVLPPNFETVIIPNSNPKTKPKALNYGLKYARGKYTVVYDAEDIPDPLQLKKAVVAFSNTTSKTVCIQAKLNFFNPHQNLLTRVFTAEYSLWFDLVLTGLQSIDAPIPLGGTSNHFPTTFLRKHQGWDAFNVTEDCDLGIRLFKNGYRTQIVDSTTYEEANSDLLNWVRQRSRWIKGYIQTYFVHMRNLKSFNVKSRLHHFFSFQFIVGGKILSMFINPFMWMTTALYFIFRPVLGEFIDSFFPRPILYMAGFSLVFGNFLYLYYYMIGLVKRKHFTLVKYAYIVPFYWLGMSVAAWMAVYSLIFKPHYWAKTVHGLHLKQGGKSVGLEEKLPKWEYAYNKTQA